jgi:hypothetical protein
MNYNYEGTIKVIEQTMTFDSGFKKREIVITSNDEKFPQDVKFEFTKDSVEKLDAFKVGDTVKVAFSIRGNEYNGKFYVSLGAFTIAHVKLEGGLTAPSTAEAKAAKADKPVAKAATPAPVAADFPEGDDDDLPF